MIKYNISMDNNLIIITINYLTSNLKNKKWYYSYRIKNIETGEFMNDLNDLFMLIRVKYHNNIYVFYWIYNEEDIYTLIDYVNNFLKLEAHEIIIHPRIKLFYDIDLEISNEQLQDTIKWYSNYSNENNLTIDDVSRHLSNLYLDATIISLCQHNNNKDELELLTDMCYTSRNRKISDDKWKLSIHIITNIICNIDQCKAVVNDVRNNILLHLDYHNLEYPDFITQLLIDAIDTQPYRPLGSLSIYNGTKIIDKISYINKLQQNFQLKEDKPFITLINNTFNINFSKYSINTKQIGLYVNDNLIKLVSKNLHHISYFNYDDWDLDASSYKNNFWILRRRKPSFCSMCNRTHDNDNTLLIIINETNARWKCLHSSNNKSELFFKYNNTNYLKLLDNANNDIEDDLVIESYTDDISSIKIENKKNNLVNDNLNNLVNDNLIELSFDDYEEDILINNNLKSDKIQLNTISDNECDIDISFDSYNEIEIKDYESVNYQNINNFIDDNYIELDNEVYDDKIDNDIKYNNTKQKINKNVIQDSYSDLIIENYIELNTNSIDLLDCNNKICKAKDLKYIYKKPYII